jgi:precorrin-6A/cobalt-precorrin-6A reductase
MRLLILGGTTEATGLVGRIANRRDLDPVLSFAGRTRNPLPPPIPFRTGGFGGVAGLETYLVERQIGAVIDATHPFAVQISRHAVSACRKVGLPIAGLTRPPWRQQNGDRWTHVADMAEAVRALGDRPRRVFLTIGGVQLAEFRQTSQHHFVVRTIDPPEGLSALTYHRLILARGPFTVEDEIALMRDERIETLVTKNGGGSATEAKITAARALGIAVVIVDRPAPEGCAAYYSIDEVLAWIEAHRPVP